MHRVLCLLVLCAAASGHATAADPLPVQPWFPKAPPLAKPNGRSIRVRSVADLFRAAAGARPGDTILVAPGRYMLPQTLELRTDDVTLRGETGDRNAAVLDGADSHHGELLAITGCSGATIADLTIQNIRWNGFKLNSDRRAHRVTIYNCVAHNVWQRMVKAPATAERDRDELSPRDCRIQYCLFHNDRPKRYGDDPEDTADRYQGNYIGGIDAMQARGWVISDNVFSGIRGRTGEARGAIFLWMDCRDCVVERNIVVDCDTGICLGNSYRGNATVHCTGCVVRNNFVTGAPEAGLFAGFTRDCKILHNTVHDPASRLGRLIRVLGDDRSLLIANNLLSGAAPLIETRDKIELRGNVSRVLTDSFVDAAGGNLHLKAEVPGVTGAVSFLADVPDDIDGRLRNRRTDAGAHEYSATVKRP
jgi:hypothetical protein